MKQTTFASLAFDHKKKQTRREKFLAEMERAVPWTALLAVIEPYYPKSGRRGRQPYPLATMLRFARLDLADDTLPDETTILNFRRLLERRELTAKLMNTVNDVLDEQGLLVKGGTMVDATIIHAPPSTTNQDQARYPEMHQTKKGNQWYFGMKAHIGVDADSGLVHTVVGTAANVNDVTQAHKLLHGQETDAFTDSGYQGVDKRNETQELDVAWHVAMRPGKRKALDKSSVLGSLQDQLETVKARIRAKVEHPFRVIKQQFGHTKTRYKGLMKNTHQLHTLFALSNLWMVRKRISQGAWG